MYLFAFYVFDLSTLRPLFYYVNNIGLNYNYDILFQPPGAFNLLKPTGHV